MQDQNAKIPHLVTAFELAGTGLTSGLRVALWEPWGGFDGALGSQSPPNQLALRWLWGGLSRIHAVER